jgi:hypothetical protein
MMNDPIPLSGKCSLELEGKVNSLRSSLATRRPKIDKKIILNENGKQ